MNKRKRTSDKSYTKIILAIIVLLVLDFIIMIYIINKKPDYDKKLYDEIYSEFNNIVEDEDYEEIDLSDTASQKKKSTAIIYQKNDKGQTYRVIGKIGISKIGVYSPIIYETSDELMKIAPTKLAGPEIHEEGNLCIIGHNYRNDQFFSNLSKLGISDEIVIYNNLGEYLRYKIYDMYEVDENDVSCLDQDTNGKIEVTLITCTKDKKKRLIVKCRANQN